MGCTVSPLIESRCIDNRYCTRLSSAAALGERADSETRSRRAGPVRRRACWRLRGPGREDVRAGVASEGTDGVERGRAGGRRDLRRGPASDRSVKPLSGRAYRSRHTSLWACGSFGSGASAVAVTAAPSRTPRGSRTPVVTGTPRRSTDPSGRPRGRHHIATPYRHHPRPHLPRRRARCYAVPRRWSIAEPLLARPS